MKTSRISVWAQRIKDNLRKGENKPPIIVHAYNERREGSTVIVNGPCKIVYRPDKPSHGARVYIETQAEVTIDKRLDS